VKNKPEKGIVLTHVERKRAADGNEYRFVSVAFERDNRLATITLRGPEGGPFDVQVGEEVKAYGDIEIGDTVTVEYTEGVAMHMIKQ